MTSHEDQKILPYKPQQIFDLVCDIAKYPEFLPWCKAARIRSTSEVGETEIVEADLIVSFAAFREKFGSKVTMNPLANRIDVEYLDGPFRKLVNHWEFSEVEEGVKIDFLVEFEFKSKILEIAMGQVFDLAMRRIMKAFEDRAKELYGA